MQGLISDGAKIVIISQTAKTFVFFYNETSLRRLFTVSHFHFFLPHLCLRSKAFPGMLQDVQIIPYPIKVTQRSLYHVISPYQHTRFVIPLTIGSFTNGRTGYVRRANIYTLIVKGEKLHVVLPIVAQIEKRTLQQLWAVFLCVQVESERLHTHDLNLNATLHKRQKEVA